MPGKQGSITAWDNPDSGIDRQDNGCRVPSTAPPAPCGWHRLMPKQAADRGIANREFVRRRGAAYANDACLHWATLEVGNCLPSRSQDAGLVTRERLWGCRLHDLRA